MVLHIVLPSVSMHSCLKGVGNNSQLGKLQNPNFFQVAAHVHCLFFSSCPCSLFSRFFNKLKIPRTHDTCSESITLRSVKDSPIKVFLNGRLFSKKRTGQNKNICIVKELFIGHWIGRDKVESKHTENKCTYFRLSIAAGLRWTVQQSSASLPPLQPCPL